MQPVCTFAEADFQPNALSSGLFKLAMSILMRLDGKEDETVWALTNRFQLSKWLLLNVDSTAQLCFVYANSGPCAC
jgi:hypothetical protein